ncbi:MAG: hypothetical protein RR996_04175 [Alistipes sp.]
MKKNLLFLGLASVMLGFTGCAKDLDAENGTGTTPEINGVTAPQTIVASMGDNATRTALTPDGKSAAWSAGDQIAIIGSTPGTKDPVGENWASTVRAVNYTLQSGSAGQSVGTFDKTVKNDDFFVGLNIGSKLVGAQDYLKRFIAVYPAANLVIDRQQKEYTELHIGVPAAQTYIPNTYDPKAMTMISAFETGEAGQPVSMKFKYVNSLLCVPVTAPETITFDKIVLGCQTLFGDPLNMAGHVNMLFNSEPAGGLTAEYRLSNFTDMTQPLRYDASLPNVDVAAVTLKGTAEHPLTFGPTETNIYFGIRPYDYFTYGSAISVNFYFADGSYFEKIASANSDVLPATTLKLKTSSVAKPYMPTLNYAEATNTITYSEDQTAVATYKIDVINDGITILTYRPSVGENTINLTEKIVPKLNKLTNGTLAVGKEYSLKLVLKADLMDKKIASASYAAPVYFKYTKQPVKTQPIIEIAANDMGITTANTPEFEFKVANYIDMVENGATVTIEYVESNTNTYPFTDPIIKEAIDWNVSPYLDANSDGAIKYLWVRGVHYTFTCKAVYKDNTVMTAPLVHNFVELGALPTAVNAEIKGGFLRIKNYNDIMAGCPDATVKVYGKIGQNLPTEDISQFEESLYTSATNLTGLQLINFPVGKGAQLGSYKVIVKSKRLASDLTVTLHEKQVAQPTKVVLGLDPNGWKVHIQNFDEIVSFAGDAKFELYFKRGVNTNMDDVSMVPEGNHMTMDNRNPFFDVTCYPNDGAAVPYTYKVIAKGTGLPAEGISGVYSDPAPTVKPTAVEFFWNLGLVYIDNFGTIEYFYPDAVITVYAKEGKHNFFDETADMPHQVIDSYGRCFEPNFFPPDGATKRYTYKAVVTSKDLKKDELVGYY